MHTLSNGQMGYRVFDRTGDAPPDLRSARPGEDSLPPRLSAALADIGVR